MANNKCDSSDAKPVISVDPRAAIEIKGGSNIRVEVEKTSTKDIYTVSYQAYLPPSITVGYAGDAVQVGATVASAVISGSINEGSETIVERTMTPDKGFSLTAPISYTELAVTGITPGLWPRYSGIPTVFTAKDITGIEVTKQVGVEFRYPYYMVYTTKDTLSNDDAVLTGATKDLLTSILSKYSSFIYSYSAMPVYIYWVFPTDSTTFTVAQEGSQNVPLKLDCSPISITLPGVITPVNYKVIRTAVKTRFITTAPITLR